MTDYNLYIKPSKRLRSFLKEHMIYTPQNIMKAQQQEKTNETDKDDIYSRLTLSDIENVYEETQIINTMVNQNKIYFHELMEQCEIVLPKLLKTPRNSELDKRCQDLKNQEKNRIYQKMTANVRYPTTHHPEDSLKNQLKHLDKQLLAILQFVISVASGFIFGFSGIKEYVDLEMGDRILLGVCCSILIATAELYFLIQKWDQY